MAKTKKVSKVAKKVAVATVTAPAGKTTLKALAGKAGIEPKIARVRLRKAGLAFHSKAERWTFTDAQAAKALEVIKGA